MNFWRLSQGVLPNRWTDFGDLGHFGIIRGWSVFVEYFGCAQGLASCSKRTFTVGFEVFKNCEFYACEFLLKKVRKNREKAHFNSTVKFSRMKNTSASCVSGVDYAWQTWTHMKYEFHVSQPSKNLWSARTYFHELMNVIFFAWIMFFFELMFWYFLDVCTGSFVKKKEERTGTRSLDPEITRMIL